MSIRQFLHRQYKKIETQEHELRYLFLEISRRCNLNCLHCGSDCKNEVGNSELTTASWFKIVDYFAERAGSGSISKELSFVITGGEPTLHPDLLKIGSYISNKGFRWAVVSNGMLIDENYAHALEKAGLYALTLSLDGTEPEHDFLRNRKGAFSKLMRALDAVGKTSIPVKDVVTCAFPANLDVLDRVGDILVEKKVASWRVFRIFPSGRAANNPKLNLSFEQTQRLLDWIREERPIYKKLGVDLQYSCEGFVPIKTDLKIRNHGFFCWSGINIASILADGSITGCTNNPSRFYVGNIIQDDFATLWNEGFQLFRDRSWTKQGACADCQYWKDCQGSSIHLWQDGKDEIAFCYMQDLDAK